MTLLPRIMLGKKGSETALEISQEGSNVLTCPPEEMLFSSRIDLGSFVETGSVSVSHGGSVFIAFSLGGIPVVSFQLVASGFATFPAMFENLGLIWTEVLSTGVRIYNTTGATRVVNYQITNRPV